VRDLTVSAEADYANDRLKRGPQKHAFVIGSIPQSSVNAQRLAAALSHHQSRSPGGFVNVCGRDSAQPPPPKSRRPILRYYSIVSGPHPAVIDGLEKNLQQIIDIPLPRVDKESCWNIFSRAARGESGAK
jgi:hypothetical protein